MSAFIHITDYCDCTFNPQKFRQILKFYLGKNGKDCFSGSDILHNIFSDLSPEEAQSAIDVMKECGVDINTENEFDETILDIVSGMCDDPSVFNTLIKNGAVINCMSNIVQSGSIDGIKIFIERFGHKFEKEISEGRLLKYACLNNDIDVVRYFLENSSDKNCEIDEYGNTVIHHLCAFYGYINIIEMALEMGVRIDNVNNYAENALHYSARHSAQPEVFRLLISHGLDINCQNLNGSTALHNAIMNNNQESDYHSYLLSIKTLISLGAGPSIKRRDGQDCYDLARSIDPRGEVLSIIGGEM